MNIAEAYADAIKNPVFLYHHGGQMQCSECAGNELRGAISLDPDATFHDTAFGTVERLSDEAIIEFCRDTEMPFACDDCRRSAGYPF